MSELSGAVEKIKFVKVAGEIDRSGSLGVWFRPQGKDARLVSWPLLSMASQRAARECAEGETLTLGVMRWKAEQFGWV